jgi:DNA-directed RNA polymerase specialized sigma24 family protein
MAKQCNFSRHTDRDDAQDLPANQDSNEAPAGVHPSPGSSMRSWSALVEGVQRGERLEMEELYTNFSRGIRYYFCKHLGPADLDDRVHDAYLTVVQAIRAGSLREPEALMGFVRTIIRRQVAAGIDAAVQKTQLMVQVLEEISVRDKEILTRFYLRGQTQGKICREMRLTETQFRLLKSRAKARFGELGRKRLAMAEPELGMRKMAGA